MSKTAILIGYGGMGKRYYQALKLMKIKVIAICDKEINKISKENFEKKIIFETDYKALVKYNTDLLQACKTEDEIYQLLDFSIRKSFDPFRIHIGGEFYNQMYFDAWCKFAFDNPYRVFYAYTKSLPYWINRIGDIPSNLSLTASYGGRADNLIADHNLKSAIVVSHPEDAERLQLEIDHDDSHAIANDNKSFALLIHGTQKAGTKSSQAIKRMNSEKIKYQYSKVG